MNGIGIAEIHGERERVAALYAAEILTIEDADDIIAGFAQFDRHRDHILSGVL